MISLALLADQAGTSPLDLPMMSRCMDLSEAIRITFQVRLRSKKCQNNQCRTAKTLT